MAYHSFESHVEPQIRNLVNAKYDSSDVINYICGQCGDLDPVKTSVLVHKEPPKVLLILNEINESNAHWSNELSNKYGAITSVFEIYHSSSAGHQVTASHRAYGIILNYPIYNLSTTTKCSIHPFMTYLGINDNSQLQLKPGDEITLELSDCITFWKVVEGPDMTVWLKMEGRDACINRQKAYKITRLRDNTLCLDMI